MIGAPGRLRHKVQIQRPSTARDMYGQQLPTEWLIIATVWADIKPIGGRERLRSFALEATLTSTIMVRYQIDLLPPLDADAWRIAHGSRIYAVQGARVVDERNRWIIFDCAEGPANGV